VPLSVANNNRFEGSWANNMKNGVGKFIFLDKGQILSGHWKDDIAKCGSLEDFDREHAPSPPVFPIPQVSIYLFSYSACVMTRFLYYIVYCDEPSQCIEESC